MKLLAWASRFLALTILVILMGVLQVMVGQPLIDSFIEHRESISRSQERLARYRQLNASRAQMHGRLEKIQTAYESEGRLLSGGSPQLAGAELQNRIKYLIDANNAELGSTQLLPVREEEGFRRIVVAVAFTATTESLRSILYEIETQTPYLFVEKLELRKDRNFVANASASQNADELRVRLEIYGYMLID
jgi:general secretion pathway protein M